MFGVLRPPSPERDRITTSPNASPPPPRSLAPMPTAEFSGREELLEGCKEWAAAQGYAVVIARSRFNRLWLKCDRGGSYENRRNLTPDQRKRKRGESRLLGCPFKMIAACKKDVWRVDTEIGTHNHEPSDDLTAHPTLRRMTDEQVQRVHDLYDAGKSPAETLEELKAAWPDIKVLTRDIYNARKKYKTQKDEADATAGSHQEQPYQDPNELGLAGPSPNGKWAWVPEGEEVTNKKSKRKRRSAPAAQAVSDPALDPQLQIPSVPSTSHIPRAINQPSRNVFDDANDAATQLRGAAQFGNYTPTPSIALRQTHTTDIPNQPSFNRAPNNDSAPHIPDSSAAMANAQPNVTPSRLHLQRSAAPTATMSNQPNKAVTNPATSRAQEPKAQILMSRIERMEQEQKDQKNMLTRILGAVEGIHGSPSSG